MKKHAILIQCHDNFDYLNELINFFNDKRFDIYVHVDAKSEGLKKIIKQHNCHMIENRVDVKWGRFEQVEATLRLLYLAQEKTGVENYEYLHLISGADIPLKSPGKIFDTLKDSNKNYLEFGKLPNQWSKGGLDRVEVYYPLWMIKRPKDWLKRAIRVLYRETVLSTKVFKRKRIFQNIYGGSSWFSITGECARKILQTLEKNDQYKIFFRNSLCPDEMFFQTLIMNSSESQNTTNDNLRYIDWSENNMGSPKNLSRQDLESAQQTQKLFARKVIDLNTANYFIKKIKSDDKQ